MFFIEEAIKVSKVSSLKVNKSENKQLGEIPKKLHKFNKVGTLPIFLLFSIFLNKSIAVSYTHLTLPTTMLV